MPFRIFFLSTLSMSLRLFLNATLPPDKSYTLANTDVADASSVPVPAEESAPCARRETLCVVSLAIRCMESRCTNLFFNLNRRSKPRMSLRHLDRHSHTPKSAIKKLVGFARQPVSVYAFSLLLLLPHSFPQAKQPSNRMPIDGFEPHNIQPSAHFSIMEKLSR